MKIYVGNISFDETDDSLRAAFEPFGEVLSANVVTDRDSGRPRGFGFVEMPSDDEAQAAIEALNGKEMKGRQVVVNESKPREERPGGGGRGGFSRGPRG